MRWAQQHGYGAFCLPPSHAQASAAFALSHVKIKFIFAQDAEESLVKNSQKYADPQSDDIHILDDYLSICTCSIFRVDLYNGINY